MAVPWRSVFGVDHHSSLDCALKQARGLKRPPQPPAHPAIALIHPGLLPVGESGNKPSYEMLVRRIEDLRIPIPMRNHHPAPRFEYPRNLTCECGPISKTLEQLLAYTTSRDAASNGSSASSLCTRKCTRNRQHQLVSWQPLWILRLNQGRQVEDPTMAACRRPGGGRLPHHSQCLPIHLHRNWRQRRAIGDDL